MAGLAVEAVKFEVLGETGQADEAFQGGFLHLGSVFKLHMIGDERLDLLGVLVRELEALGDFGGHLYADFDVGIETDAIAGFGSWAEGRGLANVMEQNAPGEGGRTASRKAFEKKQRVDPDVAFGMEFRGLGDTFHGGDFGKNFAEETRFV